MKKLKIILCATLLALLCSTTQAQALEVYGFGSYWNRQNLGDAGGGGIGINIPVIIDPIRLDGRVYYFENGDFHNDKVDIIPVDLGLQIHIIPKARLDPYALGGISYNFVNSDKLDLDSGFGGYLGAGLNIRLDSSNMFSIFVEGLYRYSDINGDTDWGDLDASGFTANVGLKLSIF